MYLCRNSFSMSVSVYCAHSIGIKALISLPVLIPSMSLPEECESCMLLPVCTASRSFPSLSAIRPILLTTSPISGYWFWILTMFNFFSNSVSVHWPSIIFQACSACSSDTPSFLSFLACSSFCCRLFATRLFFFSICSFVLLRAFLSKALPHSCFSISQFSGSFHPSYWNLFFKKSMSKPSSSCLSAILLTSDCQESLFFCIAHSLIFSICPRSPLTRWLANWVWCRHSNTKRPTVS